MSKVKVITAVKIDGSKYSTATGAARAWASMTWMEHMFHKKRTLSDSAYRAWEQRHVALSKTVQAGSLQLVDSWNYEDRAYRRSLKIFKRILP
jgi:hypothetical protein